MNIDERPMAQDVESKKRDLLAGPHESHNKTDRRRQQLQYQIESETLTRALHRPRTGGGPRYGS